MVANEHRHDVRKLYNCGDTCGYIYTLPVDAIPHDKIINVSVISNDGEHYLETVSEIADLRDESVRMSMVHDDPVLAVKLSNLIRNHSEALGGVSRKSSKPISLYIDPAFACNLTCIKCPSSLVREAGFSRKSLSLEMAKRIMERYGAYIIRATLAVWGEPFLNKQLPELIALIKSYRCFVELSTNLSVPITPIKAEQFVRSGIDEMRLSIDGATPETYLKYRVGGNFELALANLRLLAETKARLGMTTPVLKWQFLEFPWNESEREQARHLAKENGADVFYSFPGRLWVDTPEIQARTENDECVNMSKDSLYKILNNSTKRRDAHSLFGCDFLNHSLSINSDGAVQPCCYWVFPKNEVGYFDDLADPFNAESLVTMREFVSSLSPRTTVGPMPCVNCGSLFDGYVKDHLTFKSALSNLMKGL